MSSGWNAPGQGGQREHDAQRRRQAALRGLAEQTGGARSQASTQPRLKRIATPPGQRDPQGRRSTVVVQSPRRRRSKLPVIVIVALVVALVAGAGVWALKSGRIRGVASQAPLPPMPAVRSIDLSAYNFSCPTNPAWSPDGTQIAISATLGDCTNQYTGGMTLAIFDARTGKLTHSFELNTIFAKQGLSTKLKSSPFAWTPDGSSLILTVGYNPYQTIAPETTHGLMTITVATGAARFVADTTPSPQTTSGATLIWDTKTGKLAHTITELAPATAYTWGADGALTPDATGSAAKGAVSVWRSGSITPIFAQAWNEFTAPPPDQTVPQSFTYTSTAPVWSPDARYLALPLSAGVRLPGGANAFPTVGCALVCQSAPVAAPNKGFSAALAAAEAGWSPSPQQPPQWNSQEIAWRADGQELATMLPGQDFNTGKYTATVTIFNASTGVVVKTLAINRTAVNFYGYSETPQIAWSPRGSSFAALNYADATLILWRAE